MHKAPTLHSSDGKNFFPNKNPQKFFARLLKNRKKCSPAPKPPACSIWVRFEFNRGILKMFAHCFPGLPSPAYCFRFSRLPFPLSLATLHQSQFIKGSTCDQRNKKYFGRILAKFLENLYYKKDINTSMPLPHPG